MWVCIVFSLSLLGITPSFAADSTATNKAADSAKSISDFSKEKSPEGRLSFLKGLLLSGKDESYYSFYSLLEKADEADLPTFREAFASAKSAKALLYLGQYLDRKISDLTKDQETSYSKAETTVNYLKSVNNNFESLSTGTRIIAEANPGQMVSALKAIFASEEEFNTVLIAGAMAGLSSLEEKGFQALLDSVTSKDDQLMVMSVLNGFRGNSVIPTLKAFEDPASSKLKQETAGLIIISFPKNDPQVLDKVVEAYKHGRYFEIKTPKDKDGKAVVGIKEIMSLAMNWWGPYLEKRFEGDKAAARYIAQKYLKGEDRQDKVIQLITEIDFNTAKFYLAELDPGTIPETSLKAVFFACNPHSSSMLRSGDEEDSDKDIDAKFELFCKFFLKCNEKQRKGEVYAITEYPAESAATFIMENFPRFSDEEKKAVIFMCGKDITGLRKGFPAELRDRVFKSIRPSCNEEQVRTIDYVLKN